jgi:hypothetical protein
MTELGVRQVSDKDVRVAKDGVAVKHSPQEADEWQDVVGTLVAEFTTKQARQPRLVNQPPENHVRDLAAEHAGIPYSTSTFTQLRKNHYAHQLVHSGIS